MTLDSLGREIGHWAENYQCAHCGKRVIVRLYAAWPQQCPHCRVSNPILRSVSDPCGYDLDRVPHE